jgi:hypothetical protein
MSRPELWFVDATILSALIDYEPTSDDALRCLRFVESSWITSEISVALCLANLERRGLPLSQQWACMTRLLLVLRHGVGLRPLPIGTSLMPTGNGIGRLAPPVALQLQTALHWRCRTLVSNDRALVEASRQAGLVAYSLMSTSRGKG